LLPDGPDMQKSNVVVGLAMVLAFAVSHQLVVFTEVRPTTVESVETITPTVGITAAVVPIAPVSDDSTLATVSESVSDAAMLGVTGATLFALAAGVRRRAC
jgi:hypothetical protein